MLSAVLSHAIEHAPDPIPFNGLTNACHTMTASTSLRASISLILYRYECQSHSSLITAAMSIPLQPVSKQPPLSYEKQPTRSSLHSTIKTVKTAYIALSMQPLSQHLLYTSNNISYTSFSNPFKPRHEALSEHGLEHHLNLD